MNLRSLKNNLSGVINLTVVLMIVIAFAGLIVVAYILATVQDSLSVTNDNATRTMNNISAGFDSSISLLLVAITIFVLALAISALLMLRQR